MTKISKAAVREYLEEQDQQKLVEEVLKLYTKFDQVKQYYQMELSEDTQELVNQYKHKIRLAYFPTRGFSEPKASAMRKLSSEFKKVAVFDYDVIDVFLYRVENGVEFSNAYGGIDEPFYASHESTYLEALKLIAKNNLHKEFKDRCQQILWNARDTGWGFYDVLSDAYQEYFGKE